MVDSKGRVAAHTGRRCVPSAGHAVGNGFSCQGNIMANDRVWGAMKSAFDSKAELPLPERLMAALDAAQEEGGDLRGKQSSAMLVVGPDARPNGWEGRLVDLRVEDHQEPLMELRRLLRFQAGYRWIDKGDDFFSSNRMDEALEAYSKGMELVPEVLELKYWVAGPKAVRRRASGRGPAEDSPGVARSHSPGQAGGVHQVRRRHRDEGPP